MLLYCNFITQFAGEKIVKIEHLAKSRTKWLIALFIYAHVKIASRIESFISQQMHPADRINTQIDTQTHNTQT